MSFLRPHGRGLYEFCIPVHCHERKLLCISLAQISFNFDKNSRSKLNFWTFEWLGENLPNSSNLVWNQESVFLQTLHHPSVSWNIILPYFFISIFICFRQKNPIKVEFFRHSLARLKISQIHYVILQVTSRFSFKFYITLQCHGTSLWNFLAETLYALDQKSSSTNNFQTLSAVTKVHPIPHIVFGTTWLRFIRILHPCSVLWKITLVYFFGSIPHILWTKVAHESEIFGILSGWVKIHQIPHVLCGTKSQFFFKRCITVQCHET